MDQVTVRTRDLMHSAHEKIKSKDRKTLLLGGCVFLPTVLLFLYLFLVFSPMYISESQFALRSGDSADLPSLAGLFFQNASTTTMDAHIVNSHVSSMNMLEKISQRVDLQGHYGSKSRDPYSRLRSEPTKEELLNYWQWIVSASFKQDKGFIEVKVKGYDPETAKRINDLILEFSEELVNQMNERSHQDSLRLTKVEVEASERRLIEAQNALRRFRDDKSILNPESTAKSLEGLIAQLEGEASAVQTELNAALQIMQPSSPRVQGLERKLKAIRDQLAAEKARLAGLSEDDATLSSLVGDYAQLAIEEEFAQKRLTQSMAAFEGARLKALSQSRYIVPFQPPTLPQESLYPRPFLFTAIGFIVLLVSLGLVSLILAAIKDHMGV